ncbi:MAG: Flp family type IVb pilin [Acidimicrobiia bacterium]
MLRLVTAFQSRFVKNEEGAGMVEYALLVALIGVLLIGAIGLLTGAIDGVFGSAQTELEGAVT